MHYGHKSEFFGYQTEYLIYIWVFIVNDLQIAKFCLTYLLIYPSVFKIEVKVLICKNMKPYIMFNAARIILFWNQCALSQSGATLSSKQCKVDFIISIWMYKWRCLCQFVELGNEFNQKRKIINKCEA